MKTVYDLCFTNNNEYAIYKRYILFEKLVLKEKIATFQYVDQAVKFLKSIK